MKGYITLLKILLITGTAFTQISPPDFQCIKGDTLFWQAPVNTCGPFIDYEIFYSTNKSGPYQLAAKVAVITTTNYFHPNPTKELRYYYMRANYVCTGQPMPFSDTLDNRPPEISPIRSVSVDSTRVIVTWQTSPSPEVYAYVIYRETPIGVIPVDTISSGTTFIDLKADPTRKTESYFVNAIDKCGNTSIFDVKHTTMLLKGTVSQCEQAIDFVWNRYQNWPLNIGKQEIWVGINGAAPTKRDSLSTSQTTYRFRNVQDGSTYCFYIRAEENGTGAFSKSNQVCFTASVVRPMKNNYIQKVTVNANGNVEITWNWDSNAEIKRADILRSAQNNNYLLVQNLILSPILQPVMSYNDLNVDPGKEQVFYKILTQDLCDTIAYSSYGSTIFLSGSVMPNSDNLLSWKPYDLQYASVISYDIFRALQSGVTKIGTVPASTLSFADSFDPALSGQTEACYHVVANARLQTPDGKTLTVDSRSNTFCMEQAIGIYVPNAFAPNGVNAVFLPNIIPQEFKAFEMKILDRYGNQMYYTKDPSTGGDGSVNGKAAPTGVYVYQIKVTRPNDKLVLKSGTVTLLR
jgi:gliding motility-associated-like protein